MRRIFSIRINLDEMSAQLEALDSDAEKLQWLAGFRTGGRGTLVNNAWTEAKQIGARFGLAAHEEARVLSERQAANAHKRWHPVDCQSDAMALPAESLGNAYPIIQESKEPRNPKSERASAPARDKVIEMLELLILSTQDRAVNEWKNLLQYEAGVGNGDEAIHCLEWMVNLARNREKAVEYAKHCLVEAREWRKGGRQKFGYGRKESA